MASSGVISRVFTVPFARDVVVHIGLDLRQCGRVDRARLREVEAQPFRRDQAALLRDVQAEPLAERLVQQMRRRVVGADAVATRTVDRQVQRVADGDFAFAHGRDVRPQPPEIFPRILDLPQDAGRGERSRVADLPAALGVEGRLVDDDLDRLAGRGAVHPRAVLDDRDDLALAFLRRIADELRPARAFRNVEPHIVGGALAGPLPGGAGGAFLFGHRRVEPGAVDAEALRAECILGQIVGKPERVVELERRFTWQRCAGRHTRGGFVEQAQAVDQGPPKLRLFLQQGRLNRRLRAHQFRVRCAHLRHQSGHQAVHQRLLRAEQMRMPHRAPHDPPQHIAAPLVRRKHAVRNEKARGAQMIGDHAVARLIVAGRYGAGQRARCRDQRLERVGIVIVVHAL